MGYNPINLSSLQLGIESGGQQFDENGKPLTSKKGAIGVAQVMPDTGPEAARLAGLPWDENRYRNDREYNLRLGDAYQGHLDQRFGKGSIAATAAYNAGPTRVARLQAKYGDDWARYLPAETRKYVKNIKGVDVGQPYYTGDRASNFADDIMAGLKDYSVAEPGAGDRASVEGTTNPHPEIRDTAVHAGTTSDRYTAFLESAIQPLHDNAQKVVQQTQGIAETKHKLLDDFQGREADLEAKITPLMQRKEAIVNRLMELDSMHPLERKLKAAFNSDYDPRVLRGRLERINDVIKTHEESYTDLNTLRSGVAALSIDATNSDTAVVNAQSESILADGRLLGQVSGAVRQNVSDKMLPYQVETETMRLDETKRQTLLGRLTLEDSVKALHDAQASPDGSVTIDGIKLGVGDLQKQATSNQQIDLSLRSMQHAYSMQDLQTADQLESNVIEHMTPEQVTDALRNNGQFQGHQLSMMKLAQAGDALKNVREDKVNEVILGTSYGQAATLLHGFADFMRGTGSRAQEMFGNTPQELSRAGSLAGANIANWQKGFTAAQSQGVGREYIARTAEQLQGWQTQYDGAVDAVAKRWGGGKTELESVASAYLRGNPLSGDAATKGLITIARSGLPAGAKLSGPALQALQVAQSIVKDWDNPNQGQTGDSLAAMLKGNTGHKDSDLMRLVQDQVGNAYANSITDTLMNQMPDMARSVRDPNNPGKVHPFARVTKDDFVAALRHGDNDGYTKVGNELGITAQQAQAMFAQGVNGEVWQQVKKAKGFGDSKFADILTSLVSVQMAGTLAALDASHSAAPGFSPAKAFVDFLSNQDVQNQIDTRVNAYGKSSFGAFITSSAVGGGYRDSWNNYSQGIAAVYSQLHGSQLSDRIKQQRSLVADPFVRMNAVVQAAGASPAEAKALMGAIKPLVNVQQTPDYQFLANRDFTGRDRQASSNFDQIATIVRNHKLEDPALERIRQRVAKQWDAMDAIVGTVADSLQD